jgi:hypothetical protein
MFKLEGEQYSLEQVTSAAEQSNMSLEDYLKEYNIKKLEETVEPVEKLKDVVEKDATVTSIKPEQASENTELEQVDTSLELQDPDPDKPLSASEKRIATRKKRKQEKIDALKAEAISATNEIQGRVNNIPEQDIISAQANNYFGPIKSREDRTTVSKTMVGMMGPTVSFEPTFESDESYTKYLKETLGKKYDQYLGYLDTKKIKPLDVQNKAQLEEIYNESELQVKDKVYNNSLFNVPEDVQEYMVASPDFASGAESLEAQKFLIQEQKESIDQNYKSYEEAKKQWESEALPLKQDVEDIKNQIDRFKFYSAGASQEQADQYNELIETYNYKIQQWEEKGFNDLPVFLNSQAKLVNSQQKDYSKMLDDSRKALVESDLFEKNLKKDYSVSARVGRAFDEFFVQSGRNFIDLTAEIGLKAARTAGFAYQPLSFLTSPENSAKVDSLIETIQKNNKNYNLGMTSKRENIPTAPSIDDIGKDGLSVWDWTSISLQDSSPTILTTFVPGGLGIKGAANVSKAVKTGKGVKDALQKQKALWLAGKRTVQGTFFVAETGGKYGELQTDEASREKEIKFLYSKLDNTESVEDKTKIYDRIKDLEEVEDYSLLQKAFTSFGAGATATYLESIGTLKMLEPAKGLAKQIGISAAKKELYKQPVRFSANLIGKTLSGLKSLPKNLIGETLEEAATEISHNALDILVLDENKSMFEGVDKDFIANTMVSSFGIMAPKTGGNILNIVKSEFRTKSEIFDNQKLASELIELNESTTPENSKQLRDRKKQVLKELALSDAISLHKLRYMTAAQIEEVADINRQMRQVNGKFAQLGGLGDLGEAENKRVKKQLENEYSSLTTARQELLDAKQRSNAKKAANINEALGNAARNSESAFYFGVNNFYNDLTMTQMGDGDFISIKGEIIKDKDGKAIIKYENLDDQLAKYKEKLSEEEFNKFKKEIEDGDFNAKQFGKDIIVNQPVIDRNIALAPTKTSAQYAAVAPLEELFHLSVAQKSIKFDSTAKNAVLEAEKVLKEKKDLGVISEKDYNGLKKRFDLYRDGKDFNAEEFIAQINNAISLGAINRSDLESTPSFKKFLNNTIRSTFGDMSWMLRLENSDDVFNLVKNFQTDVSKGVTFQAPDKEEVKTSLSEDIQNDLEKLEDSYFDGEIDEYQFEQKRDDLERKLKQAEESETVEKAEAKAVKEIDSVDKIVKEATTRVFKSPEVSEKNKKIASINEDIVKEMTALGANRISDIKDPDVKKAIVDKLGKNNIGAVTELAKKAAATSRNLPIDENLKVGYEEFFLGFSEELSALINSYKVNVDGKQVPFGAYMNQNLPIRYGNILERSLKGKLKGSESLSSDKNVKKEVGSFTAEPSIETTTASQETVLDQIDVRKFGPAKDKVDEVSSIVQVEDGERPTYKQLADKFIEPVSMELFNVPGKKIQGKATLTDAEAKSLQRLFVSPDNVRKLVKTMPPYNVATSEAVVGDQGEIIDVSKDIRGRSIGLSNKFIKQFYQPVNRAIPGISSPKGRSLGQTSQGQVYELKPEFKGRVSNEAIKQIQNSVGVTEAGVPNEKISADNRTKYGTTLTGFAKTYIANVINITGRSKQAIKQEQADTAAGKANMMLSKADKSFLAITGKEANIDFNDKKIVKKLKQDVFSILGNSEFGDFNEEEFVKYLLPLATKGYDYRFKTVNGKRVLVDDSKNTRNVIFQGRRDFFKSYNEYRKSKGLKPVKHIKNARTITFKDSSGQNKTIKLAILKNQSTIGLNSGKFGETLEDRVLTAQDQRNGLKRIIVSLKKFADENPNDLTTVPMFLTMLNSNTDGLVRTAAIPKWIMYKEGLKDSDYVYEHTQTASDTIVELMRAIYKSKNNAELLTEFDNIMKHFDVAIIPKENDKKVNTLYKQNGPKEGDVSKTRYDVKIKYPGEDGFPVRYESANKLNDAGIKLQSLNDFVDTKKETTLGKQSKAEKINLSKTFNDILESKSGIPSKKKYGIVEAITKGASKGRFNFFIPPSAEDFVGLLYPTLGKGKIGDAQMSWYKANLIDPYAEAMNKLSKARVYLTNNYNLLKKQLGVVPKNLSKKIEGTDYTKEQAVRVYIWNKQKMNIPGISKRDINKLSKFVKNDANLQTFADQLINMQLGDGYAKPKEGWPAGTITTDILEGLNTTKRAKYLKTWQSNVDAIFSEDNLNKLQAIYGLNYRKALVNMLERMKTGRNRSFPGDTLTGRFTDWLTGSVGAIMFFNTRSAVLQTISAINFINFKDNNVFAAAKAFGNQKQYWADFMTLMNSDFLKERRGGLRMNVNEADIADMAKKGGVRGAISKLLELGFAPTQIADSFAIASGGSTFYRNRINTYKKQGLSDKQAEKKAFEDFRETAEESQQSSRADRISMQQASPLGRVVLAFANTPAQYARIIKKAASDLKNNRGDRKENISKIIYYGAAQNLIFNALQQALFALAFSDEEPEDEKKEEKYLNIANGMLDSILRGAGIGGAIVTVGKNTVIKIAKELKKSRPQLKNIALELAKISPPVSAKLSRLQQAGRSYDWNKDEMMEKGFSLDNPAYLAGANVISALTNIPLDRAIKKANNVVSATSQDLEAWERIALIGGWQDWELGIKKDEKPKKLNKKKLRKKLIKKTLIK